MNPRFRYAAAGVLIAIIGWLFMARAGTIVLADVVKAAEKHTLVRHGDASH